VVVCVDYLQVCSNGTRVFVHKDIWERFVPALVARTQAMKIGNPLSEETTVGATISREHAEKVLSYIDRAKQAVETTCFIYFKFYLITDFESYYTRHSLVKSL